jgi:hypothetical protein
MRKLLFGLLAATMWLVGCVTIHGPTSFTLSREDIERGIETDLGSMMEALRGLDGRRPEVAFMPVAGRLELAWYVSMPSQSNGGALFGNNIGLALVVSGKPQLNAGKSGVMLTDVKVEDVRLLGLPNLLGLGQGHLPTRKDTPLPDLPLFSFAPGQLKRADVAYGATGVEVTYLGLRVDIEPR